MSSEQQEVRLIRGQGFDDKDPSIIRDYNNYSGAVGCLFSRTYSPKSSR